MSARLKFKVKSLKFKVFALFLSSIFYLLSSALIPPVYAQQTIPAQPSTIQANQAMTNLLHVLSCLGVGQSPIGQPCFQDTFIKSLPINNSNPYVSNLNTSNGLLGAAGSVLGIVLSQPPINTSEYLADTANGFGITPKVNAQVGGSGSNVLNPILTLWQVSRNFAYIIMILIFITIGLMVMFRHKINPQTVVTVQSALPGLIIGLVLITFSYFAAALITDMAFVGTDLVGYYFNAATGKNGSLLQQLQDENAVSIGSAFVGRMKDTDIMGTADAIINNLESWPKDEGAHPILNAQNVVKLTLGVIAYPVGSTIGKAFGAAFETFYPALRTSKAVTRFRPIQGDGTSALFAKEVGAIVNNLAGVGGGLLFASLAYLNPGLAIALAFYLISIFAILYAVFRLLLALINTYLAIIFLTITAPFHFLVASVPGRQDIAVNWARNMLASILTFPAVIAVFYFAAFLLGENKVAAFSISQPLQVTGTQGALPLFGGFDMSFIRVLLAIGAVLATPKIPELLSKSIGKPGAAGGAFDQAINQAIGQGQRYSGQLTSGVGKMSGDVKEGWTRWRGSDPYASKAEKINFLRRLQGKEDLPTAIGPELPRHVMSDTQNTLREINKLQTEREKAAARVRFHQAGKLRLTEKDFEKQREIAGLQHVPYGYEGMSGLGGKEGDPETPPTPPPPTRP